MFEYCQSCLRQLTDAKSREQGFGPECKTRLGDQRVYLDAGKTAVLTGATSDSKLIVLGRILQRTENSLMQFRPQDPVPRAVTKTLVAVRADFEKRVKQLQRLGLLHVPEPETQLQQVAA